MSDYLRGLERFYSLFYLFTKARSQRAASQASRLVARRVLVAWNLPFPKARGLADLWHASPGLRENERTFGEENWGEETQAFADGVLKQFIII